MQITGGSLVDHNPASDVSGDLNANTAMSHSPETLVQLCRLWPHIHKSPPPDLPSFCVETLRSFYLRHPALNLYDDRLSNQHSSHRHSQTDERTVGIDLTDDFSYTSRSLSLVGVLGGILFILLTIAFVTLIKHRKRFREREGDGLNLDRISSHLRQLQQARSSQQLLSILGSLPELPPSPPPDYETVEKLREKEENGDLPSYLEATGRLDTVHEEADETRQCMQSDESRQSSQSDESRQTRQSDESRQTRESDESRHSSQSDESRQTEAARQSRSNSSVGNEDVSSEDYQSCSDSDAGQPSQDQEVERQSNPGCETQQDLDNEPKSSQDS